MNEVLKAMKDEDKMEVFKFIKHKYRILFSMHPIMVMTRVLNDYYNKDMIIEYMSEVSKRPINTIHDFFESQGIFISVLKRYVQNDEEAIGQCSMYLEAFIYGHEKVDAVVKELAEKNPDMDPEEVKKEFMERMKTEKFILSV